MVSADVPLLLQQKNVSPAHSRQPDCRAGESDIREGPETIDEAGFTCNALQVRDSGNLFPNYGGVTSVRCPGPCKPHLLAYY